MNEILICLAACLITGLLMSRLAKVLNLPAVTAYLVAGLLLGPFCLGKIGIPGFGFQSLETVESYKIISQVALGFIAFAMGNEFRLAQLKSMGDLESIMAMIPGMDSKALKGAKLDEKAMARQEAIILSMTKAERENPSLLNSSRKKRIAAGCGLEVVDINRLLKQYENMQQMVKQMSKGKMPGMPGLGGMGGRMHGFGRKKRFK